MSFHYVAAQMRHWIGLGCAYANTGLCGRLAALRGLRGAIVEPDGRRVTAVKASFTGVPETDRYKRDSFAAATPKWGLKMAHDLARGKTSWLTLGDLARRCGVTAVLAGSLMAGGCAQLSELGGPDLLAAAPQATTQQGQAATNVDTARSDLATATTYWGEKYGKDPKNLEAAVSYAKNLKAMGRKRQALAVLQQAARYHPGDRELQSEYGRLALALNQISVAQKVLAAADDPANPDWRVISARGTVYAKQGRYEKAIPFYEKALTLAHNQPSVMNNLALAYAMQGQPEKGEQMLRQAAESGGSTPRIRQNLALILGLQGKYAESKHVAAGDQAPAKAAANADYLRRLTKLEPKSYVPQASVQVAAQGGTAPNFKPATTETASAQGGWTPQVAAAVETSGLKGAVK